MKQSTIRSSRIVRSMKPQCIHDEIPSCNQQKRVHLAAHPFPIWRIQNYSALGASSVVVSAVASAGASVAAADFLERRVRVAFLAAVLAMFSS